MQKPQRTVNFIEPELEEVEEQKKAKILRQATRGDPMLSSNPDGSQRIRMLKQKSSYLSDFECDSEDETKYAARGAYEWDH